MRNFAVEVLIDMECGNQGVGGSRYQWTSRDHRSATSTSEVPLSRRWSAIVAASGHEALTAVLLLLRLVSVLFKVRALLSLLEVVVDEVFICFCKLSRLPLWVSFRISLIPLELRWLSGLLCLPLSFDCTQSSF